jgi:hypothetical protein
VAGTNFIKTLASLVLRNLEFEDRVFIFTQNTLELEDKMQSRPWASPPPIAGVLKASPPRSKGLLLGSPLPAWIRSRGPPPSHEEQVTSWLRGFEHPRLDRCRASVVEVEISPPCRHRIVEASRPPSWMSSETPPSPPLLQLTSNFPPLPQPPWPT